MLTVERLLEVSSSQQEVWSFVRDMGNWAAQMPGYQSHEIVDDHNSVWTVQLNVGPFTRPCVMEVLVTRWAEPAEVNFTVKGRFDPFRGEGRFLSEAHEVGCAITLNFGVEGTGSMAKVISAMAAPVLTKVADQFVQNLAHVIGSGPQVARADTRAPSAAPDACGHAGSEASADDRSRVVRYWGRMVRYFSRMVQGLR